MQQGWAALSRNRPAGADATDGEIGRGARLAAGATSIYTMYWFLFCGDELALTEDGCVPQGDACPVPLQPWNTVCRLPLLDGVPCRAVRLDAPVVVPGLRMAGLRTSFRLLPADLYGMAGKARELLYWDANTKFCGVCGAPMRRHTDISKRCTACGKEVWPSPAIAIIVAVTRDEGRELLMVQSRKFKADYMGLVAGFVETGETLEECVVREVLEETGLRVGNIRYFASQPWPYPCGLMVGFKAECRGGSLRLQHSELTKGGWFSPEELRRILVPGRLSMARMLIDDWLDEQGKEHLKDTLKDF